MCVNKSSSVLLAAERVTHRSSPHLLDSRSRLCRYSAGAAGGKRSSCRRGNIQAGTSSSPLWYSALETQQKNGGTRLKKKGLSLFQDTVFNQTHQEASEIFLLQGISGRKPINAFSQVLLFKFFSDIQAF